MFYSICFPYLHFKDIWLFIVSYSPFLNKIEYINFEYLKNWYQVKQFDYKQKFNWLEASNVGSVVEFSPATREARVRFPDVANFCYNFIPYWIRETHIKLVIHFE